MRSANSVLFTKHDKFEIGDGWGGDPDCIQVISDGHAGMSMRFIDIDCLENMISALTALAMDLRMRRGEHVWDAHETEGRL